MSWDWPCRQAGDSGLWSPCWLLASLSQTRWIWSHIPGGDLCAPCWHNGRWAQCPQTPSWPSWGALCRTPWHQGQLAHLHGRGHWGQDAFASLSPRLAPAAGPQGAESWLWLPSPPLGPGPGSPPFPQGVWLPVGVLGRPTSVSSLGLCQGLAGAAGLPCIAWGRTATLVPAQGSSSCCACRRPPSEKGTAAVTAVSPRVPPGRRLPGPGAEGGQAHS